MSNSLSSDGDEGVGDGDVDCVDGDCVDGVKLIPESVDVMSAMLERSSLSSFSTDIASL